MPALLSDYQIIQGILQGGNECNVVLEFVYKSYYKNAISYINRNNGNEEDGADIFQDSIVIFCNQVSTGRFKQKSSIKTYLISIVKNLWLKELRSRRNISLDSVDTMDLIDSNMSESDESEKLELIYSQISNMTNDCRKILIDFYYHKKNMSEIKTIFNLGSENAAKNKKYRCLQRLIESINRALIIIIILIRQC